MELRNIQFSESPIYLSVSGNSIVSTFSSIPSSPITGEPYMPFSIETFPSKAQAT